MTLDLDSCYRALGARDRRFDGVFFVGVETTGIYCRPVCPARTPARSRCVFFQHAAQAERAGFRACFRCRPELAPGAATVDAVPRLAAHAARLVEDGFLDGASVDELAALLGVTARHLRRAMEAELGVAPLELAQTRRLALAKQLLADTSLPISEIAFASGFQSVRRFNTAFRARFGRTPSAARKHDADRAPADAIELALEYRPPLAWDALLGFLAARAIPGVESVSGGTYRRVVALDGRLGWLVAEPHGTRPALRVRLSLSLAPGVAAVVRRVRALFDLDARPDVIDAALAADPCLAPRVAALPGLRVPGAFDPFELVVRAVLGQQISVGAATTLAGRFAERFGTPVDPRDGLERAFPGAARVAALGPDAIAAIGLPHARAASIAAVARAISDGRLALDGTLPPAEVTERLGALPGIGPWTASYVAMRALGFPDAFPASDLAVRRALGVDKARDALERARAWHPWRAYATLHLWTQAHDLRRPNHDCHD